MSSNLALSLDYRRVPNIFREGRFMEVINTLRNPANLSESINQLNWVKQVHGEIGGNHYHYHKWERIVVLNGVGRVILANPETAERYEAQISKGDIITLVQRIAHALTPADSAPWEFLEFTNKPFDNRNPKDDCYDYKVL